jgi:hypothetical protein
MTDTATTPVEPEAIAADFDGETELDEPVDESEES